MKKILIVLLCCILLCWCGSSRKKEAQTVSQKTEDVSEQPTNAVDASTSEDKSSELTETEPSVLEMGGIAFTVPGSFGEVKETDATDVIDNKYYYPKGDGKLPFLLFLNAEVDWTQDFFDNNRDKIAGLLLKGLEGAQISAAKKISIGGLSGGMVTFKDDYEGVAATGRISFAFNPDGNRCISVLLVQEENAGYDYSDDYDKVVESAEVISQPQPSEEEADSPGEETVPSGEEGPAASEDTVNPELKEFLDSYEACINEYVDFMKKYTSSDDVMGMLADYTNIMSKYADFTKKMDNINEDDLTGADLAYYVEVTSRCTQKMLEIY